jgi:predicted glycoside hydrolase/deacetylase ChbG (UPF0249 family)
MAGTGHLAAARLVVNADDFGISAAVNDGIIAAHRSGIVTAASLMAVGRAFEHAVAWCRHVPSLDIGVHLTLVAGTPLRQQESSLTCDDGRFPADIGAFLRRYLGGAVRPADIELELGAQIERVLDHGLRVTHLDSHQHVHALPGIAARVMGLAARYSIPFVRAPVEEWRIDRPPSLHGAFRLGGAMVLRTCWTLARLAGGVGAGGRPLRFLGFTEGGRLDPVRLRRLLQSLQPGRVYELMCHPGFLPDEPDIKRWNYRHEQELLALTRASVHAEISARGIRLCRFQDLI